jgi:nucleotide-binding universal stress UspA family protein
MAASKRILFPTDFSEHSRAAIPHLMHWRDLERADLHLVHVLEMGAMLADFTWVDYAPREMQEQRAERARQDLQELRNELGLPTDTALAVLHGAPFEEITQYARKHDIDLIVMATHGRSGLSHFLLGSTTERVVRHAPCPVLTVRIKDAKEPPKTD